MRNGERFELVLRKRLACYPIDTEVEQVFYYPSNDDIVRIMFLNKLGTVMFYAAKIEDTFRFSRRHVNYLVDKAIYHVVRAWGGWRSSNVNHRQDNMHRPVNTWDELYKQGEVDECRSSTKLET